MRKHPREHGVFDVAARIDQDSRVVLLQATKKGRDDRSQTINVDVAIVDALADEHIKAAGIVLGRLQSFAHPDVRPRIKYIQKTWE